jgi:hypothetical protein
MGLGNTMSQTKNDDLEWDLANIQQAERARRFVSQFENLLCVYSPSINQIYSNYTINFPADNDKKLVVLPNPYSFHDTFTGIDQSTIRDTGLFIIPGELIRKKGLYIYVKLKNTQKQPAPVPLKAGLARILSSQNSDDPFLPVLVKGDLREFRSELPCLHLHRLKLSAISGMSQFEKKDIQRNIVERIKKMAKLVPNFTG